MPKSVGDIDHPSVCCPKEPGPGRLPLSGYLARPRKLLVWGTDGLLHTEAVPGLEGQRRGVRQPVSVSRDPSLID